MRKVAILISLGLLVVAPVIGRTETQSDIVELASQLDEPLQARKAKGVVREVDYANRQAVIGGYVYDFGPPGLPITVTLKDGGAGAFELLVPDMKVEVVYGELSLSRIAVIVTELPDDAIVEH